MDLDQQTIDLKRQLQVIEQEAVVLRSKVQSLENENEKLATENKRLSLLRGTRKSDKSLDKYIDHIAALEVDLDSANRKIKEMEEKIGSEKIKSDTNNSDYELKEKLAIVSVSNLFVIVFFCFLSDTGGS